MYTWQRPEWPTYSYNSDKVKPINTAVSEAAWGAKRYLWMHEY